MESRCLFLSVLALCCCAPLLAQEKPVVRRPIIRELLPPVTLASLLDDLTDLDRLPEHPGGHYSVRQASSHDRKSTGPSVATEENWLANHDFVGKDDLAQFVRIDEREDGTKEYVLMDVDGPGAIVRIWSAVAERAGNVRIYLDEAAEPVIDMPLADLLGGTGPRTLLGQPESPAPESLPEGTRGTVFPSPLCGQRSLGWNSYLPIPYAKHCKVVATEANEVWWYQITYNTYRPDRTVETFSLEQAEKSADAIAEAAKRLAEPAQYAATVNANRAGATDREEHILLNPDGAGTLKATATNMALTQLTIKLEAEDVPSALRGSLLEIFFDHAKTPQVCAPLGDFFATAPGVNPYHSLPAEVREDGTLVSYWVMPFRNAAEVRISNHGPNPITYQMTARFAPRPWKVNTMYFHAQWRTEQHMKSMPRRDWNYIEVEGAGVYVGNMLHVANANKDWWGEGDEKIFVDGETVPAQFGTGTEDYYGYACCSNALFTHAYHNQTRCDGPGNSGHTCLSRFHIADPIPFRKSLKFDMEIWHWDDDDISYAVTNYFYAKPGATHNLPRPEPETLTVPELPEPEDRVGRNLFGDG